MVLSSVSLYRYEVPLRTPLKLGGDTWRHRRGLLVRLATEGGAVGWGDAAPLPRFSPETWADLVEHACGAGPRWTGMTLSECKGGLDRTLRDVQALVLDAPASLRFAVESAAIQLRAVAQDISLATVLGKCRPTVALNALIPDLGDEGLEEATRYRDQGYRAVKVKVGRTSLEAEADALHKIRRVLGDEVALRADANRAWTLGEAVAFAEATRGLDLAYVEEPLADPEQLPELVARTDLRIALDETTREAAPGVLLEEWPVAAVVLKPTLLGGIRATQTWSRTAQANDTTPVLSGAYESGVGHRILVALAATGPDIPVGLSTYARLAADVLRPSLDMDGPTLNVESIVGASASVDEDRVTLIDSFSS